MPIPGFLSSIADKAQHAINASPLAGRLPTSHNRPASPDPATQPSANDAASQGTKSHTFEALSHQFRSLQQQYTTTTPLQKLITAEKGVALDLDAVARDSKAQSKELYTWGQSESDDLRDVTDRLAYLNFVQGSLATTLSEKLNNARNPFKALRDAEAALAPRRNIRASIQSQIGRLEHDQNKNNDKQIADLRDQLRKHELEDQGQEREVEVLKRKAVRESEQLKWEAIREYGEKLVLLSQAATPIISVLPGIPPSPQHPYTGAQTTGAVRASLQRALDNYKTGHINLPPQPAGADLSRSDTRSFGESHASELSSIHHQPTPPGHSPVHSPALINKPLPGSTPVSSELQKVPSPPIDPHTLNLSPAPIPATAPTGPPPAVVPSFPLAGSDTSPAHLPPIIPTVAETGVPVSAGPDGPGPSSGTLLDPKAPAPGPAPLFPSPPSEDRTQENSPGYSTGPPPADEAFVGGLRPLSAEEEKKRLAAAYSAQDTAVSSYAYPPPAGPPPSNSPLAPTTPAKHESAEEEKKRLEREERERILRQSSQQPPKDSKEDDLPPSYQEPSL